MELIEYTTELWESDVLENPETIHEKLKNEIV